MAIYTDHALKFTYEDLLQIPEDDPYRHEIYDGMHVATPAPFSSHQEAVGALFYQLYSAIHRRRLGRVFVSPMDVVLSTVDVFEPDITVVLPDRSHVVTDKHIKGVPSLAIEVLSPTTRGRDRGIKLRRYEAAGLPEYWIVDPVARTIEVRRHRDGAFGEPTIHQDELVYDAGGTAVRIDVAALWE